MKLTKHKGSAPGTWAVHCDGKDTGLSIVKGIDKKWGDWQEWHLMRGDDLLMTQRRASDIIPAIEILTDALRDSADRPA